MTQWSAIVLTGGTNTRFGSDKSTALLGDETVLQRLINEIPSDISIVIVGDQPEIDRDVIVVREEPALGGPVAAIAAGLTKITTDRVAVFATDMPFAPTIIGELLSIDADAVIPIDENGYRQPLAGLYKYNALAKAIKELGVLHGESMKKLLVNLDVTEVKTAQRALIDIDTPEDLAKAREVL